MADNDRIRRQQVLREVEGYIELIMAGGEQFRLSAPCRDRLARRALDLLGETRFFGRSLAAALYLEGQALRLMEQYRQALQPLERSAKSNPSNIHVWLALGWCHKRTGRLDLAIQSLEEALGLAGGEAIIHYNLACYWSLAGNRKLSLTYLSQALDIDPNYRDLIAEERDFDPLRSDPEFQALTSVSV
jgi:tetratricopeptide (TPR) repeat protein